MNVGMQAGQSHESVILIPHGGEYGGDAYAIAYGRELGGGAADRKPGAMLHCTIWGKLTLQSVR